MAGKWRGGNVRRVRERKERKKRRGEERKERREDWTSHSHPQTICHLHFSSHSLSVPSHSTLNCGTAPWKFVTLQTSKTLDITNSKKVTTSSVGLCLCPLSFSKNQAKDSLEKENEAIGSLHKNQSKMNFLNTVYGLDANT